MNEPYLFAALALMATVVIGLLRILPGQGRVERLLALQLLGTTLVAAILLLAYALETPGLLDLALVLGLLAASLAVAFVRFGGHAGSGESES